MGRHETHVCQARRSVSVYGGVVGAGWWLGAGVLPGNRSVKEVWVTD